MYVFNDFIVYSSRVNNGSYCVLKVIIIIIPNDLNAVMDKVFSDIAKFSSVY